ncbi:MAG: hypothetical protein JNM93_00985 [Bacteriovoracaceae bacterium]|nr:hypothetical protein [Bacteriovoracaceae bacterium]
MYKFLILSVLFYSSLSWAQNEPKAVNPIKNILIPEKVKTQKQLAKYQVGRYVKTIPKNILDCSLYLMKVHPMQSVINQGGLPALHEVLKFNHHRNIPETGNQFAFTNGDVDNVCERNFGYCHGYTFSLTTWNRLSHFDEHNVLGAKIPDRANQSEEWFQFYKNIIDEIMHKRNPIVVPGFKNLFEFSESDPRITNYLKEHIALKWAERNISFSGVRILKSVKDKFTIQEGIDLHKDLSHRINDLHYNPIMWVASPFEGPWKEVATRGGAIHVMQAFKVSEIVDDQFTLYLWDIYNSHNADEAVNSVIISLKEGIDDKKRLNLVRPDYHMDTKLATSSSGKSQISPGLYYSEIEQVPWDQLVFSQDVGKLKKFYEQNPAVTALLEKQYQERLRNPPPPYMPPYTGVALPPIILADRSLWNWPKEWIRYDGQIKIAESEIGKIPEAVNDVLKIFGVDPRDGEFSPYIFQIPEPFLLPDGQTIFHWDPNWISYEGYLEIPSDQVANLPEALVVHLKDRLETWPPNRPFLIKHVNNTPSLTYQVGETPAAWNWRLEWLNQKSFAYLPSNAKDFMPTEVIQILEAEKVFSLKTFNPHLVQQRLGFQTKDGVLKVPLAWFNDKGKIDFPKVLNPDEEIFKKFFVGLGDWPPKLEIDMPQYGYSIKMDDGDFFHFPMTWIKNPSGQEYSYRIFVPIEQTDYVPVEVQKKIIHPNKWPPANGFNLFGSSSVELRDGTSWEWPRSWLSPRYEIIVPQDELDLIPQKVIDENFNVGIWSWPPTYPISPWGFNTPYVALKEDQSEKWYWPREWMIKDGRIKIPKGRQNEVPENVIDILKTKGKWPPDKKGIVDIDRW